MNRSQQILILCGILSIGIVAVLAGIMMYMNAGAPTMTTPAGGIQKSPSGYDLSLLTVDVPSGEPLGNVSVYLDGGYDGSTSDQGTTGILELGPVSKGRHTIRVSKSGYLDYTQSVVVPSDSPVRIGLQSQLLVPIQVAGSHDTKIDIVFIPSGTTYDYADQEKITTTPYVTNRSAFVTDVNGIVNESLFTLDTVTDTTNPIPSDYRNRFNIYYYYDSSQFADAFDGCSGSVPDTFWETVPFADVVIILYPPYSATDAGTSDEPEGCVNHGSGRSWMKTPDNQNVLFQHEIGHAIFGLVDTYCGDTLYWQNDPHPNVWSSQESCVADAINNSWDPSACRQIEAADPASCTKPFWRWDPDPDIMHEGYSGTFGKASTQRMTYVFNNINIWGTAA
ncbi:hypothetical protein Mboo_1479 [Methanoregula boonei 6A8]|jgi:hypothetical protein|uniref:PEGA domain-containing protein n=1 Tax=Methanoregula boonei (strain DSM 21154 / JCM 14090 / 6A8) TaxID=456442 RepID=A7I8D6_METB6|nr:hypothetical protein [Methanoregula boonei]ABS55997.1 hypothetical protein Mboo_1479 [Methanoregula boonei 6A8]